MKSVWFVVALALAILGSGPAQAQTAPPPLDHFRCYFIPNQPVLNIPILLQDQFDAALPAPQNFEHINQLTLARICNTVQKTVGNVITPMTNINHHLTMYQINPQPIIPRVVRVSNQFDVSTQGQTLDVSDARFLLVNTGKIILPGTAPSPSPDLDHYKCYAAGGNSINKLVGLKDQFTVEGVNVLWPVLFCNPVLKIHGNVTTSIQNNRDHLTCYATSPSVFPGLPDPSNSASPAGISILNQFGLFNVPVQKPDLLCVPSLKLSWSVVPAAATATAAKVEPVQPRAN